MPSGGTDIKVHFVDTQATVDVTAKDGTAIKRLQGKVDLTAISATSTGASNGVTPGNHDVSEFGLQSATAICKRYEFNSGFTIPTATGQACQDTPHITMPPPPTVTLNASPGSIQTGQSSTISWTVTTTAPLASCTRSSNPAVGAPWDNDTSTALTGNHPITFSSAGTYKFTETCKDILGQTSAPGTATVTVSTPPAGTTCQDPNATNYGGPLPCQYPSGGLCTDPAATNNGGPLPCQYPSTKCQDPSATNYGGPLPCQYPSGGGSTTCQDPNATNYGGPLPCQYPSGGTGGAINVYPVCAWNTGQECQLYNSSNLGSVSEQCHDGLHAYIICISWNATNTYGTNLVRCNALGNNYTQNPYDGTVGAAITPPLNNWWNVTFGWYPNTQPTGNIPIRVTCFDNANHSGYGDICTSFYNTCAGVCPAGYQGTPPNCTPIPPPPPPPSGNCNSAPYAGGTYPNCYCLYPGGTWPNCQPPPSGGGGCGLNIPGSGRLWPEFGFLSFIPYTGIIIC